MEAVPCAGMIWCKNEALSSLCLALGPVRAGQGVPATALVCLLPIQEDAWWQLWPVALCVFGDGAASQIAWEVQISSHVVFC